MGGAASSNNCPALHRQPYPRDTHTDRHPLPCAMRLGGAQLLTHARTHTRTHLPQDVKGASGVGHPAQVVG